MNQISILGKIIFLMIMPIFLMANISSHLDKKTAVKGDAVTLTISAVGKDIEFPNITDINGNGIVGTSSSSQVQIINGKYTQEKSIRYKFIAQKTLTIKPFIVVVDGKEYKTKIEHLKVRKPKSSKEGDAYQLKLIVDKTNVYVGEAIRTILEFKYKIGLQVLDLKLEDFKQKHFWIKAVDSSKQIKKDGYNIIRQEYIIFPQSSMTHTIGKQLVNVATRNMRSNFALWNKIYSNEVTIDVKELPKDIEVQGTYILNSSVDKNTIDANKPVNLTIKIQGFGNIDDIDSIELKLNDELVYTTKPEIKTYIKDGKYGGEFIQKISIVADSDFTIPSIEFKYFDIKTKKVKVLKSKPIKIKVNTSKLSSPKIETKTVEVAPVTQKIIIKEENSSIKYIYAIVGLLLGILISYILMKKNTTKVKTERPIDVQIKKAKSDKALYEILLPYSSQVELKDIMKKLENNIYNNGNNKMDKKEIIEKVI